MSGRLVRHPADDTLHRLMDGGLSRDEAAAVERHVAACDRCRSTLDALERLRRAARAAPREVAPPGELWDAIGARIARAPRASGAPAPAPASAVVGRPRRGVGGWVAAAALLALAGGGALMVGRDGRDHRGVPDGRAAGRALVTAATRAADAENVRALEAAVASTAAALAASPDNVHLERMLERARRQRAEYLQSARSLTTDQ